MKPATVARRRRPGTSGTDGTDGTDGSCGRRPGARGVSAAALVERRGMRFMLEWGWNGKFSWLIVPVSTGAWIEW